MDARELRIGNYIQYFGNVVQVEGIVNESNGFGLQLNGGDFASINSNSLEPIPLTEEWLLKFGFKAHTYEDEVFGYVLNDFGYINEYQFRIRNFIDFEGIIIPKAIKTVHQLQNLYFLLTAEELTLKNK